MNQKKDEDVFHFLEEEDLNFTEEDRVRTFEKLHNKHARNNKRRTLKPLFALVAVFLLAIGALLPSILSNEPGPKTASVDQVDPFSILLLAKDGTETDGPSRSVIQAVLSINPKEKSVRFVDIPRDTHATIFNGAGEVLMEDKITHVTAYVEEISGITGTYQSLLDIPIDYYVDIPTEEFANQLNISIQSNMEQVRKELREKVTTGAVVKELIKKGEIGNLPNEQLNKIGDDFSVEILDVTKNMEPKTINGIYYEFLNKEVRQSVTQSLQDHLGIE